MFVERKDEQRGALATWLDERARRHPRLFDAVLVLLTVCATIGLLLQRGQTLVLYQGF